MLKNEIKSLFRNKSNKIYIIVFIFLFLILNLSLNLNIIIDKYYDDKMQKELEKAIESSKNQDTAFSEDMSEIMKEYLTYAKKINIEEIDRMVRTSNGKELTEKKKKKIQNMKHVESIERNVEKIYTIEGLSDWTVYYILVDSWKNCDDVQDYLDSIGISSYVNWGTSAVVVENYERITGLANIIKYTVCSISILVLFVCCHNIIKNEKENAKLLNVFGYKERKIKNILFIQLLTILFLGACLGYLVSQVLTFAGSYYLLKTSINVFNIYNIIILVMMILLPIFILTRKFNIEYKSRRRKL